MWMEEKAALSLASDGIVNECENAGLGLRATGETERAN